MSDDMTGTMIELLRDKVNFDAHFMGCSVRLRCYHSGRAEEGDGWVGKGWDVCREAHYGGRIHMADFSDRTAAVRQFLEWARSLPEVYRKAEQERRRDFIADGREDELLPEPEVEP